MRECVSCHSVTLRLSILLLACCAFCPSVFLSVPCRFFSVRLPASLPFILLVMTPALKNDFHSTFSFPIICHFYFSPLPVQSQIVRLLLSHLWANNKSTVLLQNFNICDDKFCSHPRELLITAIPQGMWSVYISFLHIHTIKYLWIYIHCLNGPFLLRWKIFSAIRWRNLLWWYTIERLL